MLLGSALTISGLAIGTAKAQTPAPAAPATPAATAPAAPAKQKIVVTGLVDGYYGYYFANPKGVGSALYPSPDWYVVRQSTPALSLAELNLTYAPPSTGGFGAKATLISGDTADFNVGGPREARYKNIQQLYVTWALNKAGAFDFGKFYTPFGYEVVESNANFNYTRSVPFTALLPIYHAGLRYTSPVIAKGLTLAGYVVNSIDDTADEGVSDDNNSLGYIGQANWTDPAGKYVLVETFGYSEDKNIAAPFGPAIATDDLTLSDTDITITPDPKDTIGFNYTYRQDHAKSLGNVTANGYAVYYRRQVTAPAAVALRYSGDSSKDDITTGSPSTSPQEITATLELKSSAAWLTRLEYRHDFANQPLYATNNVNGSKSQDLAVVGVVYTFGP
jgi:predicted porin